MRRRRHLLLALLLFLGLTASRPAQPEQRPRRSRSPTHG